MWHDVTTILAPVSVNASDVYEDRIELVWVDVSEVETGYEIWRTLGTSTPEMLATTPANVTTYTDYPLDQGVAYRYCIKSILDSSLESREVCDEGIRFATADTAQLGDLERRTAPARTRLSQSPATADYIRRIERLKRMLGPPPPSSSGVPPGCGAS